MNLKATDAKPMMDIRRHCSEIFAEPGARMDVHDRKGANGGSTAGGRPQPREEPHLSIPFPKEPLMHHLNLALADSGVSPASRYSLSEVARILGRDLDYVRYLVNRNKLAALKVGRQTWGHVRHEDLADFLNQVNGSGSHA